ncbi:MAG: TrmB family transcriptional regulator [Candidatus Helarchaeota archaeon]
MSSDDLITELRKFLKSTKLSNYEIKAYLTLLKNNDLTAREISRKADIPTGRIYDVLGDLKEKEMIEIQNSRPKIYRLTQPNRAFNYLISQIAEENKRRINKLSNQAKYLESKLHKSELIVKEDTSKIFWSTAFGWRSVFDLYIKKFTEVQEELLMTGFIDNNTIRILHLAKPFFLGIKTVIKRGIPIKYLWSFDFDTRPLSDNFKRKNETLYNKLIKKVKKMYDFTPTSNIQMKFIHNRIPNYFDVFDKKRVLIKLQDPLNPSRFYAAINVLDPNLATELRNKFYELWLFAN